MYLFCLIISCKIQSMGLKRYKGSVYACGTVQKDADHILGNLINIRIKGIANLLKSYIIWLLIGRQRYETCDKNKLKNKRRCML